MSRWPIPKREVRHYGIAALQRITDGLKGRQARDESSLPVVLRPLVAADPDGGGSRHLVGGFLRLGAEALGGCVRLDTDLVCRHFDLDNQPRGIPVKPHKSAELRFGRTIHEQATEALPMG